MHRFIFLVILALGSLAVTWRGRKISWWAFGISFVVDFVVSCTMEGHDRPTEQWEIAISYAMGASFFGQIFMAIWYATIPPTCPHCGQRRSPPSQGIDMI